MSEHILTKTGNIIHVTSVYELENMSEVDILKMIAPVEIPELRKQVAALTAQLAEKDISQKWLNTILCYIHRDGGQYLNEAGERQCCQDAVEIVCGWRDKQDHIDDLERQLTELIQLAQDERETLLNRAERAEAECGELRIRLSGKTFDDIEYQRGYRAGMERACVILEETPYRNNPEFDDYVETYEREATNAIRAEMGK